MNWGIIGYGEIAPAFITGLAAVPGQRLCAVASLSKYLQLLGSDLPGVRCYNNYDDLLLDKDVEIVYVCTTNHLHKHNALAALQAGKHVLCEKPACVNLTDLKEVLALAQKQGLFYMEGMWTRCLPAYRYFKDLLEGGSFGAINFLRADFGFFSQWGDERRLKNRALFGGTLLDNADYNLFLAQDVFRAYPQNISAFGKFEISGVESTCGIMLQYPEGGIAQLFSSFQQSTRQEAVLYGEKGYIRLEEYWRGTRLEITIGDRSEELEFPFQANGFEYEISEVANCISEGRLESAMITHKQSLEMATLMDEIILQLDSFK